MERQSVANPTRTVVRCGKCGSHEVDIRAWISPNLGNAFAMYYDGNSLEEVKICYCHACGERSEPRFEQEEITPYRRTNCGSTDVQRKVWARPNNYNEYVDDVGECETHEDDCWCDHCEGHHVVKLHHEFMEDIDHWFLNELQPDDPEAITGLYECDFPSAEAYDVAVATYWNSLSDEQKINCWKALTYNKRTAKE